MTNRQAERIQMMTLSHIHLHDNMNTEHQLRCWVLLLFFSFFFFFFSRPSLTVVVCVQLGFELLHLPLVAQQQRPVFPQRPHPVLLLVLRHLLNEGVLLVVGDA